MVRFLFVAKLLLQDSGSIEMDFDSWKNMFLNAVENDALVLSKSKEANKEQTTKAEPSSKKKLSVTLEAPQTATREYVRPFVATETIKAANPTYNVIHKVTNLCPQSARTKKVLKIDTNCYH